MIRSQHLAIVLALTVGGTACDSTTGPTGPSSSILATDSLDLMLETAAGARAGETTGDAAGRDDGGVALFEALAAHIPGFAGLYRVRQCAVVVVLTADGDRAQALPVVRRMLAPIVARSCGETLTLTAEAGEYSFHELQRYLKAVGPVATMRGVDRPRIDFKLNRLVVPVASREVARAVQGRLAELGIPLGVVVFDIG